MDYLTLSKIDTVFESKTRSFRSRPLLKTMTIAWCKWCKRWHKRKDSPIYSPPDRTDGRQFGWHTVFHCQKSKLRMRLRWNNVRSEVIYERVVEAMGLPVRVVNCGNHHRRQRIRGCISRQRKQGRRRRHGGDDGDEEDHGDRNFLHFPGTTFTPRNSLIPISTAIEFFFATHG